MIVRAVLIVAVVVAGVAELAGVAGARSRSVPTTVEVIGQVAWSPTRDELAVGANVDGEAAIFLVHPDGSGLRRVTPAVDPDPRAIGAGYPVWSQNGDRLAFTSGDSQSPNGGTLVRVIDRDATRLRTIATGFAPSWAPNGQQLVFETFDPTGSPSGLAVADAGSGTVRQLLPWSTSTPEWEPHGRLIAFAAGIAGSSTSAIWLARADASTRRRIAVGADPAWSSDGRLLAYSRGGSICMIRADGSDRRCAGRLPVDSSPAGTPDLAWAPGRQMLAVLVSDGNYSHRGGYVINLETGRQKRVLGPAGATAAYGPAWSRDGRSLALVTRSKRILIVHDDGSDRHYLDLHT
jgi:Tol biopolymer transport system component